VLGDPNGARAGAQLVGGLLGAEPHGDPQDQHLALPRREQLQQPGQPLGEFPVEEALFGAIV
jgi:hypothetical protein